MAQLAPVIGIAVLAHFRAPRPDSGAGARAQVLPFALAGFVLAAWISRAHVGGYDNTLIPACAAAALLFGPALQRGLEAARPIALGAAALALGQFELLRYDPRAQLPTADDLVAGEALVDDLRAVEGELWIPDHGYLAERAGKQALAHGMTLIDLLQSSDAATAQRVFGEITQALETKRFAAIVLDQDWDADLPLLARNYARREIPYVEPRTFLPVTGDPRRPRYWYARR
jgi:hypothetical protein